MALQGRINEMLGKGHLQKHTHDIPFAVHLCAKIDLEVFRVVHHIQKTAALIKFGDAECQKQG